MRIALEVAVLVIAFASVLAFFALMLWGARQDGRDQRRYQRLLRRPRRR